MTIDKMRQNKEVAISELLDATVAMIDIMRRYRIMNTNFGENVQISAGGDAVKLYKLDADYKAIHPASNTDHKKIKIYTSGGIIDFYYSKHDSKIQLIGIIIDSYGNKNKKYVYNINELHNSLHWFFENTNFGLIDVFDVFRENVKKFESRIETLDNYLTLSGIIQE